MLQVLSALCILAEIFLYFCMSSLAHVLLVYSFLIIFSFCLFFGGHSYNDTRATSSTVLIGVGRVGFAPTNALVNHTVPDFKPRASACRALCSVHVEVSLVVPL